MWRWRSVRTPLRAHSSIAITGDVYGHTSDDTARSAVDGWSGALGL
jgi:integrase